MTTIVRALNRIFVIRGRVSMEVIFLLVLAQAVKLLVGMRRFLPVAVAFIALIVYFLTTCRGIWIGDSGEFALALKTLGIAHPPGYPLFTILGALFVQALGFLRPIFAGGIFNVTVAAAAVGIIYVILRQQLDEPASVGLALCWAFTPIFWGETNGVEIYTLNLLLIAITYLALERNTAFKWPLTIYLFGLSLCNHPSALALAPAIIYHFVMEREYRRLMRLPFYLSLLATAGSMYLYLWLRSTHDPVSDWGNPESFGALWQHMSLQQYSGWVSNSWDNLLHSAELYVRTVLECWSWFGGVLIISGAVIGLRTRRKPTIIALLILLTALFMAAFHQAINHEPFYILPLFASLLLISNNFTVLCDRKLAQRFAVGTILLAALLLLMLNYQNNDKSDYTLYDDYSRNLLDAALPGSTLFVAGDINAFGPVYLHYAENYRSDLQVFDRSIRKHSMCELASRLTGTSIEDLLQARAVILERAPGRKYFAKSHYQNQADWWEGLDSLSSFGILYDSQRPDQEPKAVPIYPAEYDGGDLMSRQLLANLDLIRGEENLLHEPPDSAAALTQFRLALRRYDLETRGVLLNQLGIYFRKKGEWELALTTYEKALKKQILTGTQRDEIEFNISNVYKDRGNLALANSSFQAAAWEFEQAVLHDPENPRLLLNLGLIYAQHLNDRSSALRHLTHYLELQPSDSRVQQLVQTLR